MIRPARGRARAAVSREEGVIGVHTNVISRFGLDATFSLLSSVGHRLTSDAFRHRADRPILKRIRRSSKDCSSKDISKFLRSSVRIQFRETPGGETHLFAELTCIHFELNLRILRIVATLDLYFT